MSDIKLFRLTAEGATELAGRSVALEKSLQTTIEKNLETFLGVRFMASEYSTGKTHSGRIDTLGIDENRCPVIIEYKRALNENVINQGLFYLDWLLDHKAEFTLMVMKKFGEKEANAIDWSSPRLLCIAGDFTKYDEYAVQQINRNIELIRYRRYGDDLLLFELVKATTGTPSAGSGEKPAGPIGDTEPKGVYKTVSDYLAMASDDMKDRYESLKAFLLALGDDVQLKETRNYFAFRRLKNFACVSFSPQAGKILVYAKVTPEPDIVIENFSRDMRGVGHWGTGDLEITITSDEDLERAKPLLIRSYEGN